MNIDWNEAPEWANYAAMDEDGEIRFHKNKPRMYSDFWGDSGKSCSYMKQGLEWKESLQERPE